MRKLIYIPIVHTETDMGSLNSSLKEKYIQKYGQKKWIEHVNTINAMWDSIEKQLDTLRLCYKNAKVYQDGLPNCGIERDIVADVAKKGSANYQLVLKLIDKGAELIGTEDPKLLIEEYKTISNSLNESSKKDSDVMNKYKKKSDDILLARDKYISQRIDETLNEDDTGILFIGMMHKIKDNLPKNIKVELLFNNVLSN